MAKVIVNSNRYKIMSKYAPMITFLTGWPFPNHTFHLDGAKDDPKSKYTAK